MWHTTYNKVIMIISKYMFVTIVESFRATNIQLTDDHL